VLSVHGENDPVVPVEQARALDAALRAAGVDERLIVVAGAAHELGGAERDRARDEALRFLAAAMGPPTGAAAAPAADPRASVTWRRDVVYLRTAGVDLHLDVALPVGRQGLTPVVVCFHHGPYTPKARADLHGDLEAYAAAGLAAVTVEYRGPVKGAYPTPVEDGRAALRFVKAHAAEWAVDPARIAVVGAKIGGWVALHLALNPPADDTPRPAVAVVRYAPTDLTDPAFVDNPVVGRLREVLVGQPHPSAEVLRRASPLSYVSTGDPAVLLFHNPLDRAIPFGQSERLAAALATAKAEVRLERLTGSGHGSERVPQTDPDVADAARVLKLTIAFVQAH
jgi:dipeptidyl aminopeptidase/acylaminoacyl peptidase